MPTEPKITSVSLTPNPANINGTLLISAAVTEVEVIMYVTTPISGTLSSGQKIILITHTEGST